MFSLDSVLDDLWPQARPAPWQKSLLKRLFYEDEFQQFAAAHRHLKGLDMVEQVLEHLDIVCTISARDLEQIPEHGPLVIIANHPTGTLDGLALLYAVSRVRRDVKVVTNRMLTHLEPLSSLFIPVDNMGGRTAKTSLVQMEQHLQNAGVLIFFPAGEVSRPTRKGIRDKKWHPGFIKLAGKLRVPLLPVHIQAHNSLLFYASTLLSPTLSMLLLMQQMFRRRHSQLPIKIGQQIAWHHWHSATLSSREMAEQCRQHVMRLGKGVPGIFKTQCAIARPEDRATLKRALAQAECLGKTSDGKTIYLWQRNGQEDAPLLRELGRLREIAFRAVEEGSGKRRDTDRYDDDYLHLILWDDEDLEIVGAYRFMPTASQVERRGLEGLYSYSLFHYDDKMQDVLEHGIELGRSFIQPRYWGRRGLDYLWSGIGAYLARYPHYRYLFGPVSISGGLPPAARDLLVAFYRLWFPATHPLAASRQPYPASLPDVLAQFSGVDYVDDLTKLKSLLGNLGCGIPPLYKQYSELCEPGGVQFIDFGSDPSFNDCVDGLVLVDLCYLKANRYQRYIEAHLIPSPQPSP
ncbi:TPA: lysophospholipid acyltransferase family protein [Enterobacter sichuanensis]|uniref:lysophospholipid acyltransferase family protein n=1 Tax=Enterobacter sichuanensis TaxID=2071710 RepID=UPI002074EFF4|nr:lysophospholipid acyltransferase family protein [Enterobacter sichuanensis]MCM7885642.1 lysophospholipid acyltransferase family protein [Enterobacter sichuanensis]MCU6427271.1 lysophospholipid acyltransferase family protein [Enterobacter sichuanensis]HDR2841774.1 lysophospholipid acyltransferase family protein [Enterobacter sichuanensis]HDT1601142.1 lysophospholipid acyltransferase family protein [Enterobacter sichuanensis]HED6269161.1 lysophospholipid acyltransferase family protein [Entero